MIGRMTDTNSTGEKAVPLRRGHRALPGMKPAIAVVIPVLNEEGAISQTLASLERLGPSEIIVVDGGSADRTRAIVEEFATPDPDPLPQGERKTIKVTLLSSSRGRARQMNEGARVASGDILLFLHADTRLPPSAMVDIQAALADPECAGGRFDVELESDHWLLRWIGALISLRSRWSRVATGDQAIFIRKEVFDRLGGFPDIPLMEDVALSRMLKKEGAIACLRSRVTTSARRWERDGIWSTIGKMWSLKLLYLIGVSPETLKRYYAETR